MTVQRYIKKPKQEKGDLLVAKYEPGRPLDDLRTVAESTDYHAELAEVNFASGTVLLVRYPNYPDNYPSHIEYKTVEAGDYLAYTRSGDFLFTLTEASLHHWYDPQ